MRWRDFILGELPHPIQLLIVTGQDYYDIACVVEDGIIQSIHENWFVEFSRESISENGQFKSGWVTWTIVKVLDIRLPQDIFCMDSTIPEWVIKLWLSQF